MEEQGIILERATFEFSQDGNCISSSDQYEYLTIECEADLGIDRGEGCFYVLKTEKWSINDEKELKQLLDRIQKVLTKDK